MKTILIIGYVWPEPKSSAAGSRMLQLIQAFQEYKFEVVFVTPCAKSDNAFDLSCIQVASQAIALNDSSFDDFIIELQPHIVVFDRFMMEEQFGWRVAEHCPTALRVLDTEDLHCLRKGRHRAFKDERPFDKTYLYTDIAKREIASIYRSDVSLVISEFEMKILEDEFKVDESLLLYVPFMQEELGEGIIYNLPTFEDRQHFMCIGNFLHPPNYQAVLYLKSDIWPLIKAKLPEAELHIYGAYAPQKVTQLHNEKQGFMVKGFAPDVNNVMQHAKVCLAPIQFGAGLKGKLIDAMNNGTPCVTTTIGAEGMYGDLQPNGFVVNDPEEFTANAVQLYLNEALWIASQEAGFKIINERFLRTKTVPKLMQRFESLRSDIESHRLANFTGNMLQHHSMQSTKYMSRWIEAKNKD